MQRQIYMLNLFVEFRFQLFNLSVDLKLRISAGMIDNLDNLSSLRYRMVRLVCIKHVVLWVWILYHFCRFDGSQIVL